MPGPSDADFAENDNGNNIIENRLDIRVPCRNCGDIITKKMCFNDYFLEECD